MKTDNNQTKFLPVTAVMVLVPAPSKGNVCRTVLYTETVSGKSETYTGMTGREFKDRWREHKHDIKKKAAKQPTRLSAHTWSLKDNTTDFKIDWKIVERSTPYNPITKKCRVCLKEKFYIMYDEPGSTLNKRQEVFNTCRHRKKKLLDNFNS